MRRDKQGRNAFIQIKSLKGEAVAATIVSAIKRYGLAIDNDLRGQGYDSESNMAYAVFCEETEFYSIGRSQNYDRSC